ncbi:MAG: GNAT family N-acetyltransferase [Pseudomonadota bacterium]
MTRPLTTPLRRATPHDADALAKLIDIAGEGIPSWLWQASCPPGQSVLSVGADRARRETGGFSYTNATVWEAEGNVAGMVLAYPIASAPSEDPETLPAPIAPFVELEAQAVGTWYINALAVFPGLRGAGIGAALLQETERQARAKGHERVSIQVYAQNTGAHRLYERVGFRLSAKAPVRDHPCQPYYTGDVLLLVKNLG